MHQHPDPDDTGPAEGRTVAPTVELLDLAEQLRETQAAILGAYWETREWGGCEAVEGLPLDDLLVTVGRLDPSMVRRVRRVAQIAPSLPGCIGAFHDGHLTLEDLDAIAKRVQLVAGRASLVDEIDVAVSDAARSATDLGAPRSGAVRLARRLVDEALGTAAAHAAEDLQVRPALTLVARPWGGFATLRLDTERFAEVAGRIADAASPPRSGVRRDERLAEGLLDLIRTSGTDDGDGVARAGRTVVAHIDIATATAVRAGTFRWPWADEAPGLSARLADVLSCDSQLVVDVFDGARPLVQLKDQATLPDELRRLVLQRDRGCRWPGCDETHVDVHHIVWRSHGGDHHPENLVSLCRRHHRSVHRHRWRLDLDPDTGVVTVEREQADGSVRRLTSPSRAGPARQLHLAAA